MATNVNQVTGERTKLRKGRSDMAATASGSRKYSGYESCYKCKKSILGGCDRCVAGCSALLDVDEGTAAGCFCRQRGAPQSRKM
jgi:hypothetical protein